ncbi:DUF262 domain-containing protein [Pseudomonas sp. BE134]|uniref:DUF262 domain-containing protein n=1 Tax=Pseudomonas sp. BE134 TaxID=2817843 RepID=UPI002864EAA6|nr:DUF262 domain-containing protein [Pseudomonas sp. BE134]MDR6927858.1 hypothetical protein [Pseudomonas sp. BE134]
MIAFIHCLQSAISFSETPPGNRQRRAWERLINYIGSSESLPEFDKAVARAEGYAQGLVDGEQIDTKSTDRDLLIIATMDQWRLHHIHSNIPASLKLYPPLRKSMSTIFQRYGDDEISDSTIRMPQRVLATSTHQYPIDVLACRFEKYQADPTSAHDKYPWAARFVMGIPVPSWARPLVWDVGQKSRFIAAVWSGADLGSYLTNEWCGSEGAGRDLLENSEILLDGQQRLHSLEEYFLDRLAVPDVQGQPRVWSEIGNGERRRFLSTVFAQAHVCSDDEMALRKTYDLCAMGVTPRTYDQRAAR